MSKNNKHKKKKKEDTILKETLMLIKEWWVNLYLFLMFVVFLFYAPDKYGYIGNNKIAFFEKVTAVFLAVFALFEIFSLFNKIISKEKLSFKTSLIEKSVIIWGIWILISFAFSSYKKDSLFGYEGWRMGLYAQSAILLSFFAVKKTVKKTEKILCLAVAALVIESFMVILQRLGFDPFGFYENMGFMDWNRRNLLGTVGNINWLMGYQICVIPVLIWFYILSEETYKRVLFGIGTFFVIAAIFLQGSSSGLVALSGIIYILLIIYSKDAARIARILEILLGMCAFWFIFSILDVKLLEPEEMDTTRIYSILWIIPCVVLLVIIFVVYYYINKTKKETLPKTLSVLIKACLILSFIFGICLIAALQISDTLWQLLGAKESLRITELSGSGRILLWKKCLEYYFSDSNVKEFIFGVGPDCFGYWYQTKDIVIPVEGGPFAGAVFTNGHNDYLTALVNYGIAGLLIYISTFATMLITFFKKRKDVSNWSLLGLMMLTGYVLNNMFSFQQVCATPIFYLVMAIIIHEVDSSKKSTR